MRILIDIDDNLYTRLFDNGDEYVADMRRACVAIRKGIPLPKGHRFIDADEILNHAFITEDEEGSIFVQKYYCIKKRL